MIHSVFSRFFVSLFSGRAQFRQPLQFLELFLILQMDIVQTVVKVRHIALHIPDDGMGAAIFQQSQRLFGFTGTGRQTQADRFLSFAAA